jgi:hypothetical protein
MHHGVGVGEGDGVVLYEEFSGRSEKQLQLLCVELKGHLWAHHSLQQFEEREVEQVEELLLSLHLHIDQVGLQFRRHRLYLDNVAAIALLYG